VQSISISFDSFSFGNKAELTSFLLTQTYCVKLAELCEWVGKNSIVSETESKQTCNFHFK
jgi:hypothetical protein